MTDNNIIELLLVAVCIDLQERMIANLSSYWSGDIKCIDMMDLTDRVICDYGYGPEDWDPPSVFINWD